jgi:hypothetical protein
MNYTFIGFLKPIDMTDSTYDPLIREAKREHNIPITTEPNFETQLSLKASYARKKGAFKQGDLVYVSFRDGSNYKSSNIQ